MIELITSFLNTIVVLVKFVINTITSLIQLIINIPMYVNIVVQSINFLPSFLIPWALAFISLVVVQYLLNRRDS